MSFADWKKRSNRFCEMVGRISYSGAGKELEAACRAAYKARERQGRKDVEEIALRAIALRELNRATSDNP